jgi:hypothetical protein
LKAASSPRTCHEDQLRNRHRMFSYVDATEQLISSVGIYGFWYVCCYSRIGGASPSIPKRWGPVRADSSQPPVYHSPKAGRHMPACQSARGSGPQPSNLRIGSGSCAMPRDTPFQLWTLRGRTGDLTSGTYATRYRRSFAYSSESTWCLSTSSVLREITRP